MEHLLNHFTKKNKSLRYFIYTWSYAEDSFGKISFHSWSYDKSKAALILYVSDGDYCNVIKGIIEDYENITDKLQLLINIFVANRNTDEIINAETNIEGAPNARNLSSEEVERVTEILDNTHFEGKYRYSFEEESIINGESTPILLGGW